MGACCGKTKRDLKQRNTNLNSHNDTKSISEAIALESRIHIINDSNCLFRHTKVL